MCWVGDKDKALSLTRKARDMESKIDSDMIQQYEETSNIYFSAYGNSKHIFGSYPYIRING